MLKSLAERLIAEFGSGFSVTNLKLMRQFYALPPKELVRQRLAFSRLGQSSQLSRQ